MDGTRAYGANIVTYDRRSEDREAIAAKIQSKTGATLIKPFDDPFVIAGQGTAGLEMADQARAAGITLDRVLVPCGGGGLVSGIALALSQASPKTHVIAVEPAGYDGMGRSLAAGERTTATANSFSLADALQAPAPGVVPFALARRHIRETRAVDDDALARAVSYAVRMLKIVVEPGGAAGLAALLSEKIHDPDTAVGIVLSGGNADPQTITDCCARFPEP
jgi:threonine dehydratase